MKNILILDIDGVLITTPPWKPDLVHVDGYSDFNKSTTANLNKLLKEAEFDIWLSSSRRTVKSIQEFNVIFNNRNIENNITGFLPMYSDKLNRLAEINLFLDKIVNANYIILDDDNSLNDLLPERKSNWVKTESLIGFNNEKLMEAKSIIKHWH